VPFKGVAYVGTNNTHCLPTCFGNLRTHCPRCGDVCFQVLFVGPYVVNMCFFCQKKFSLPIGLDPTARVKYPKRKREKDPGDKGLSVLGYIASTHLIGCAANCTDNDKAATLSRTLKAPPPSTRLALRRIFTLHWIGS
jgi:hypothetical protein